jgi:hypothetical protein
MLDNWDLAVTDKALVTGTICKDLNGNGRQDATEKFFSKVRVFIDSDNDGVLDRNEISTVTDTLGQYRFATLAAGKYKLRVVPPKHWTTTTPRSGAYSLSISAGQIVNARSFGLKK